MSLTDFIAVIIATIVNNALAMAWYSPKFLGTVWAKEHQFDLETLKPSPLHFIGAVLVSFLTAFVFSLIINWVGINTSFEGMALGFLIWLGFVVTTHFSGVIWAKKPFKVYLIDTGFQLVSLLIMGAILGFW